MSPVPSSLHVHSPPSQAKAEPLRLISQPYHALTPACLLPVIFINKKQRYNIDLKARSDDEDDDDDDDDDDDEDDDDDDEDDNDDFFKNDDYINSRGIGKSRESSRINDQKEIGELKK